MDVGGHVAVWSLGLGCYAGPTSVHSPLHGAWLPFSVVPSPSDLYTMEMSQAGGPLCCPWKLIWITVRLCQAFLLTLLDVSHVFLFTESRLLSSPFFTFFSPKGIYVTKREAGTFVLLGPRPV